MNASSNDSAEPGSAPDLDFELPVEPSYRERPPRGDWESGYRLSLAALELAKNRPEIFARRDRRMCAVEFVL